MLLVLSVSSGTLQRQDLNFVYRIFLVSQEITSAKDFVFKKNKSHLLVEAYTDADWVGLKSDWRSTTSYCTIVGGNLLSWKSKKLYVIQIQLRRRALSSGAWNMWIDWCSYRFYSMNWDLYIKEPWCYIMRWEYLVQQINEIQFTMNMQNILVDDHL